MDSAQKQNQSQSQSLLKAAEAASSGDIERLAQLIYGDKDYFLSPGSPYSPNHALSLILTLLPETCDPQEYAQLVHDISIGKSLEKVIVEEPVDVARLPTDHALKRKELLLQHIEHNCQQTQWNESGRRSGESLYQQWARIRILAIDECYGGLGSTTEFCSLEDIPWYRGIAQVLWSYRQLRPNGVWISLEQFDTNSADSNMNLILSDSTPRSITTDVQELLLPYIEYSGDWKPFQQWCKDCTDLEFFTSLASIPQLSTVILTSIYKNSRGTGDWDTLSRIYETLSSRTDYSSTEHDGVTPIKNEDISVSNIEDSFLVTGSPKAIEMFGKLLQFGNLLATRMPISFRQVVEARFGNEEKQKWLSEQLIAQNKGSFYVLDDDLKLLVSEGMLNKLSPAWLQEQIMRASLDAGHFEYSKRFSSEEAFETSVLTQFYKCFDAASNGNKTRGNMKRASECLDLLLSSSYYASDQSVLKAKNLLEAIHDISSYTFIIKQGTPAKPKEIKEMATYDVIAKILELNQQSYKEVNKLVRIAKTFMLGTGNSYNQIYNQSNLTYDDVDSDPPEIRIKAMCVDAALVNNDMETAYNYCIPDLIERKGSLSAWTACFQVGKYVSAYWEDIPPSIVMVQQMNILSRLLRICPPENIHTVLENWKRLERLRYEAGDDGLISLSQKRVSDSPLSSSLSNSSESSFSQGQDHHPQRKRDHISNLLVSGLGWALGATPPSQR